MLYCIMGSVGSSDLDPELVVTFNLEIQNEITTAHQHTWQKYDTGQLLCHSNHNQWTYNCHVSKDMCCLFGYKCEK